MSTVLQSSGNNCWCTSQACLMNWMPNSISTWTLLRQIKVPSVSGTLRRKRMGSVSHGTCRREKLSGATRLMGELFAVGLKKGIRNRGMGIRSLCFCRLLPTPDGSMILFTIRPRSVFLRDGLSLRMRMV